MQSDSWVDLIPLPVLFLGTLALSWVAVEVGMYFGARRRRDPDREGDGPVGAIVGATLGLLAFMLAFTFGLAASRYDDRREVVLNEANAIGTAYLRAGLLEAPEGPELQRLLRDYVSVRVEGVRRGQIDEMIVESNRLHGELWSQCAEAARRERSPITAVFVESLNSVIDLHSVRVQAGLRSRIPSTIWVALYFVAFQSMGLVGFQLGLSGTHRTLATLPLILTFSSVLMLVFDIDRPQAGLLRVSQQAMIDLQASLR